MPLFDLDKIPPVDSWPVDLKVLYFERLNICEFDGHLAPEAARQLAISDTWAKLKTAQATVSSASR